MPTAFQVDRDGVSFIEADPDSDLDYSLASWLEGLLFITAVWTITPNGPVKHDEAINAAPVTVDGVEYAIGQLATLWVTGPFGAAGTVYEVHLHATFTGGREDDRRFRIIVKEK